NRRYHVRRWCPAVERSGPERSGPMRTAGVISLAIVAAALFAAGQARLDAQPAVDPALRIGATDLGGVVTGANGPEAGVWVIAETTELPTKFAKIVVTDDRGRYVLPELPKASYSVWVRGYGLVDSPKVRTAPGKILNLTAVPARNAAAAAEYYPAIYWYSMLRVPDKSEFPGTGPDGNGINPALASQEQWLDIVKTNGCNGCHSLGTRAMRAIPRELGTFASSTEAWQRRIQSGQALTQMTTNLGRMGAPRALKLFADWTDRIAAVAILGRRADLGQPDEHAQPHARRERPRVVHLARGAGGEPGFLQAGLRASLREAHPGGVVQPPPLGL